MSVECPQCHTAADDGARFCTNCHYPLSWSESEDTEPDDELSVVAPGPQTEEWFGPKRHQPPSGEEVVPVTPPVPVEPALSGLKCSVCGEYNPDTRIYCQRCGAAIVTVPPPPPTTKKTRRPIRSYAAMGGIAALLLGVGGYALARGGGDSESPDTATTTPSGQTTVAGTTQPSNEPAQFPSDQVEAVASETGTGEDYIAAKMLDGRVDTAWNSCNSEEDQDCSNGEGVVLTFTFPEPIDLVRVEIANGYQKTVPEGGFRPGDRYEQNSRIATGAIVTEAGQLAITFEEAPREVTPFEHDFGTVTEVAIRIDTVRAGSVWPNDVAVSEVSFFAAPGGVDDGAGSGDG